MSYDDKTFMTKGHYVRHKYKPRPGRSGTVCERCGMRRRFRLGDWEYQEPGKAWQINNPPCAFKGPSCLNEHIGPLPPAPGDLVNLKDVPSATDEASYKIGTLWIWTRSTTEHYLMQASHRRHFHRVHGILWSKILAGILRSAIADTGMPELSVYTMLRDAGIVPLPQWKVRPKEGCQR